MSYDIHITRAESWFEDEEPITLAEVEAIWEQLPKGFQIFVAHYRTSRSFGRKGAG